MFLSAVFKKGKQNHSPLRVTQEGGYYRVVASSFSILIKQRETYPGTYCDTLSDGSVLLGYGNKVLNVEEESLQIHVTPEGTMRLTRDCFAALPLYYVDTDNELVISNLYEEVYEALFKPTININRLPCLLLPDAHHNEMLWQGISTLGEREILILRAGEVSIQLPAPRSWDISEDARESNPHNFKQMLEAWFEYFYETRLAGQSFAYELSGGLDSCTLPLYLKQTRPNFLAPASTLIQPGDQGAAQITKLHALQKQLQCPAIYLQMDPAHHYPLSRFIGTDDYHPFSTRSMPYAEVHEILSQKLKEQGISVVVTGFGGDDIFENITHPAHNFMIGPGIVENIRTEYPPFYTAKLLEDWQSQHHKVELPPVPLIPASLLSSYQARNNTYIERGIWPVSQFASPGLYKFCQGLPAYMRANKNILRAYHQARSFPAEVYAAPQNESFIPFIQQSFASGAYNAKLRAFLKDSLLVDQGYINPKGMEYFINRLRDPEINDQWLFYAHTFLSVEINLRSH